MRKLDIANEMAQKFPSRTFSVRESLVLVEVILDSVKSALREGEDVKIPLFGNFLLRQKRARKGRNPKTGEAAWISSRRVVTFKPSLFFKELVGK